MMYILGTLEEYLIENPIPLTELDAPQKRKWENPKKDNEYLWPSDYGTITEDEKFNIVSVWTNTIIKPKTKKYYINKNGKYTAGVVNPGECMASGLKNLDIFDDEEDFLSVCDALDIDVNIEEI